MLDRKIRWLAVDAGSADHPMNTVIRKLRPTRRRMLRRGSDDRSTTFSPRPTTRSCTPCSFPHDVIHIENLGGDDRPVLDQRIQFGCFPWRFQGGEAAFCRAVAFLPIG